ncbi:MAG: DUF1292 domain-containing protein [Clostridiales bacterium]|nr:DUF1292 domain-containing protein [Clostridiales bacterium]
MKAKDPIKQILDEKNIENIILHDENNNPIEFEQIAVIPLEETNKLYAILIPITPMQGVEEGEGVLFELDEEKGDLIVINDEKIIDKVIAIYEKMLNEGESEE